MKRILMMVTKKTTHNLTNDIHTIADIITEDIHTIANIITENIHTIADIIHLHIPTIIRWDIPNRD